MSGEAEIPPDLQVNMIPLMFTVEIIWSMLLIKSTTGQRRKR